MKWLKKILDRCLKRTFLDELRKEYATQPNACIAYPIYVQVQELLCIGVIADGYSVNCPYGDGETITKYRRKEGDCDDPEFDSADELIDYFKKEYDEEVVYCDIQGYQLGYIWHPVEFFLTRKGAQKYMKANAHNHGKLRIYIEHFERRNFEMRRLLEELGFKTEG